VHAQAVPRGVALTLLSSGFAGNVSMGLMHATPGDMKSFRSSAERMALMASYGGGGVASSELWKRPARNVQ
jgi:hypothetical protein